MQGGCWTAVGRCGSPVGARTAFRNSLGFTPDMVLFLHNRYRTTGGEERVVEDLMALVREQLGEQAELLDAGLGDAGPRVARRPGCCAEG